ncbi:hypothetical protein OIE62_41015 (plasmid) [Streptomyces scopuliridis]|uniref:Uncharacterized protein n=1 Tax=Streptomyces scopuliridis TaxID=452529 RepID=A0ACD5A059_9ACTN|nr:hypothetical protein [Streptomyces scopuliridis]WSC03552.1 hypothetical protein OG835_42480 [Streptomyces scopuliridis]WSC11304.1 hypothetical protein OIE62_41015 [Streptomyces scopuliridis]
MPEQLEGRTTDPATWMRTPENLGRLAAFEREANARRRAVEDQALPAPAVPHRQEHERRHQQPAPGQGQGIQP